jgi:tellurite resistance protein TerC
MEYDPKGNVVYRLIKRILPIHANDVSGKFTVVENGKRFFTALFVVVVLTCNYRYRLCIGQHPAVFAISQDRLVIYTSNIFAVLGLRSLFFLLQGAANQFEYLQQGIAIVLIFIGLKMLAEAIHIYIPVWASLMVIVVCLFGSILYSVQNAEKDKE